ncbi:MAG: hypothetical protein IPH52_05280 [Leptospiraceae bacterium]|nr:hypothetical protein [Leptospiraceae bacterium]MBK7054453.1 hypothetical protein [Leptospiraceae bacterium]HRG49287.1 hypothetical protein [Leptospiraceae bacterium]
MSALKNNFYLCVTGLLLLATSGCNKSKEDLVEEYILILREKNLYENYSVKSKAIGICPIGTITKSLKEIYLDKNISGERVWNQVDCNGVIGYLNYEHDISTNKEKEFLFNNKKQLIECYEYSQEIQGKYQNKKAYLMTLWAATGTTGFQIRIDDADDYAFFFNLKKLEPYKYSLFTNDTEMIIQKTSKGVTINVIKDESGKFRRFHGDFTTYVKPKPRLL